jgi:Leucine-rich repeat (LRR) protein
MFIKKDLRKIPIIFSDAKEAYEKDPSDKLVELRLARRPAEFKQGSIAPLCQPHYIPSLMHLQKLSLYDCQISTLEGIQFLADSCPILEEMNLGRNPLKSLPSELGSMKALKSLSLDDCEVEGDLPSCLYELDQLQVLRMSNNFITKVDGEKLDTWKGMEVLCLDGNLIEHVPAEMQCLIKLKVLMLR